MATWQELSEDNLRAARKLLDEGHYRSSISRSYYVVYCIVTAELIKSNISFPYGWNNPAHDQLRGLVQHNLALPEKVRRRLRKTLLSLRTAREDADYRPIIVVDRRLALACLQHVVLTLRDLEMING